MNLYSWLRPLGLHKPRRFVEPIRITLDKIIIHKCGSFRPATSISSNSGNVEPQTDDYKVKEGIENLPEVGQPTHYSHPLLLKLGEITPNITLDEYQTRRQRLLHTIEKIAPNFDTHIVVIPSSHKKYMTEKIPYVFRQDSDFLYMTGCLEPDCVLILMAQRGNHESILFLRGKDSQAELWDGPRTGFDQAPAIFGVDHSLPWNEFSIYLRNLLKNQPNVAVWYDYLGDVHSKVYESVKNALSIDKVFDSPRSLIHRLRLCKSPAEQELMRRTCAVGSEAIIRTMKSSYPGCNEAHLFARVDFESRMLGAQYLAYPPVVAGGNRANIIHYINNNQIVKDGELILMDAGCELHGYTSDITRTWPISGKYSKEQRALYEMLYEVQTKLIEELAERPSLTHLFHSMCSHLGRGLVDVGVVSNKSASNEELSRVAYQFCPHHVSHYLGMDVHDTSSIPRSLMLEPGMVVTVEPGIYINSNNKLANPAFRGIGMRIEDDVLITETDPEVLTSSCPKHPDDIERTLTLKGAV